MAKDRLRRRIAKALQGSSVRDELKQILEGRDEVRRAGPHGGLQSILDNVKDPILSLTTFFSLDDFGTGLSSLTYPKNLPVDYVKIDGQFVRNVLRDAADECVVESIARMAHAFKIHAIAERVESRDVMKRLGELGVSFAQGYFVAVPQPVSELPAHSNVHPIRDRIVRKS